MALGIMRNGVPLDTLFGPKGATKAADTGLKQNGVDVSNSILALADGTALGFASGVSKNGADFNTIFGHPTGNTPLPINGNTYSAQSQSGTASTSATYQFTSNSGGWAVSGTSSTGGAVTPGASGSLPTGASTVQFTLTLTTSNGTGSTANTASTAQPVSSSVLASVTATSTPSTVESDRWATLQIVYFNASSVAISTTNINIRATAQGSA